MLSRLPFMRGPAMARKKNPIPGGRRPRVPDAVDDAPPRPRGGGNGNGPGRSGGLVAVPGPVPDMMLLRRSTMGSPAFSKQELKRGYRTLK